MTEIDTSQTEAHQLTRNWRLPRSVSHETAGLAIADTIAHMDDLVSMLEYDKDTELARDLVAMVGRLRAKQSDYMSAAQKVLP